MTIVTLGIDLAKNVFAVPGVDESGKAILIRQSVKRAALLELIASYCRASLGWRHVQALTSGRVAIRPVRCILWLIDRLNGLRSCSI